MSSITTSQFQDKESLYVWQAVCYCQPLYAEPHRYWHTWHHIEDILNKIASLKGLSDFEITVLQLTALFHDAVYLPYNTDNEVKSAELFQDWVSRLPDFPSDVKSKVISLIEQTAMFKKPADPLSKIFFEMDSHILTSQSFTELLEYEKKIFKEFQFVSVELYKQKRVAFLMRAIEVVGNRAILSQLIEYVRTFRPTIGVFAGSFNPFHRGHYQTLTNAEKMFDKVIVARGINIDKVGNAVFESEYDDKELKFREVASYSGLIIDYLDEVSKHANPILIRGIRNSTDLAADHNLLETLNTISGRPVPCALVLCDKEFEHISSSAIREVHKYSPERALKLLRGD